MRKFESLSIGPENLSKIKSKVTERLDEYKNYIIENYSGIDGIDVEIILAEFNKEFGEEEVSFLNISAFLRKINQILQLKSKKSKRLVSRKDIKVEFTEYYASLDSRIKNYDRDIDISHYDELEGEGSIISRKQYDREKYAIQVELLKLQEWVVSTKSRVAIVFEGRDSAGKGSTIKRFIEYLNPRGFKVVALGVPTEEEKNNWFGRYEKYLPNPGEIIFFDRSWYNRAVVEPSMGYCSEEQYRDFMETVSAWEKSLTDQGVILIKFWFSITKEKQVQRFDRRKKSLLKYWKFSPNDAKVVDKWDIIGKYKNQMFEKTSTEYAPWVIVNSNDKKVGRLNAMRYTLSVIPYDGKNPDVCQYYPEVINIIN